MNFIDSAKEILEEIISWRRSIHSLAEISFQEYKTQSFIESVLDRYNIEHQRVANTGVLAKINSGMGDTIGVLRADMDALEIIENTGLPFACTSGQMHACGHDMHSAALLGALVLLKQSGCKREIWGLFQPGEELHPGGASIVLAEDLFAGRKVDWFLAQHCSPEIECGSLGVRGGQFMASTDEIHIDVLGEGGHGAMPHLGKDAVLAASAVVVAMQQINSRNNNAFNPSVISFGRFIAGGATNILPDVVNLEGTFRTMDEGWRKIAKKRIVEVAEFTALAYGCTAKVEVKDGYPCVYNDLAMVDRFKKSAETIANVIEIDRRMTAEDFGFYSHVYPSLMVRLGVGRNGQNEALHTSRFNPTEDALAIGAAIMAKFASEN